MRDNFYRRSTRPLLHEPEKCRTCGKVFIALYPLVACVDHEGEKSIY